MLATQTVSEKSTDKFYQSLEMSNRETGSPRHDVVMAVIGQIRRESQDSFDNSIMVTGAI